MSAKTRTALIDISADAKNSNIIDFGEPVQLAWVHVPTLTASSKLAIHAAPTLSEEAPSSSNFFSVAADLAGGAVTGGIYILDDEAEVAIGPFRYFKIVSDTDQEADRSFTLAGLCYY